MVCKTRIEPGAVIEPQELLGVRSEHVRIPDSQQLVHLQFRRFAGCPVCNLHLHSIAQRHAELVAASIREVAVFHATVDELLPHVKHFPFSMIADPEKRLYVEFGVESAPRALLDPRAWAPILRGVARSLGKVVRREIPSPALNPHGGRFGLPADFLIASDGNVLACKYGSHAYNQWSVDELLELAREHAILRDAPNRYRFGKCHSSTEERIQNYGKH
jgi:peroxiredoxin